MNRYADCSQLEESALSVDVRKHASKVVEMTAAIAAGDEEAFSRFHADYFDRLYRYLIVVHRGDETIARDSLQETLIRVVRHCRRFEDAETFWRWLAATDHGRKQSRYWNALKRFIRFSSFGPEHHDQSADPVADLIETGIRQLDPVDQGLVEGKYFERLSVVDLARKSGLSEKAVESRLHRARKFLKTFLTDKEEL